MSLLPNSFNLIFNDKGDEQLKRQEEIRKALNNDWIHMERLGLFKAGPDFFYNNKKESFKLFSNFIILNAKFNYEKQSILYLAVSDLFEIAKSKAKVPLYKINFNHYSKDWYNNIVAKKTDDVFNINLSEKWHEVIKK